MLCTGCGRRNLMMKWMPEKRKELGLCFQCWQNHLEYEEWHREGRPSSLQGIAIVEIQEGVR